MKSIALVFAAIIATTASAWATPAPSPTSLTHSQLIEIVQHADADVNIIPGLVGAHLLLDLRPSTKHPYFVAADNVHGIAFICQVGFEDFAGGPVAATVIGHERGEDGRDYVKLNGCTGLER
jgi:hypothetical protein